MIKISWKLKKNIQKLNCLLIQNLKRIMNQYFIQVILKNGCKTKENQTVEKRLCGEELKYFVDISYGQNFYS